MGPTERRLFLAGGSLLVAEALALGALSFFLPGLAAKIAAMVLAIAVGGRTLGIAAGLAAGLPAGAVILVLILFNTMFVLLFYTVTVSVYANLVASPLLRRVVRPTARMAEKHRHSLRRWPALGLFVFIWLPFPWTGAAVGAVIGFLLGLSSRRVMCVALPAMLFSVITWTLGFDYLFLFEGAAGRAISAALVVVLLAAAVWGRARERARGPGRPEG